MSSFSAVDLGDGRFATLLTAPARGWGDRWAPLRAAIACTLAWLIASAVSGNTSPLFAPIVALLTLQASVYSSVALATQRILGSVLGVMVATLYVNLVGLSWWSLALAVAVAVLLGTPLPDDDPATRRLQTAIAAAVTDVATSPGATVHALDSVGILARLEQLRADLVDHAGEDPDQDR